MRMKLPTASATDRASRTVRSRGGSPSHCISNSLTRVSICEQRKSTAAAAVWVGLTRPDATLLVRHAYVAGEAGRSAGLAPPSERPPAVEEFPA